MQDDRSDFTRSRPLQENIGSHVLRTSVPLSEALLAHDVYVCLERPNGALPPESHTLVALEALLGNARGADHTL